MRFGANTILDDWTPPEVLTLCFPGGFFGEDRGGHPVWYDCMGNLDFRGRCQYFTLSINNYCCGMKIIYRITQVCKPR